VGITRSAFTLRLQFIESVVRASAVPPEGSFIAQKPFEILTIGNDVLGDGDLSCVPDSECLLLLDAFDATDNRQPDPLRGVLSRAQFAPGYIETKGVLGFVS
jgi:hypothetical protein